MTTQRTTKEKIARAAIELIAARGVDAVSMRDIAVVVQVSEAALYRHYANKNSLVWEVFTSNYDWLAGRLAEVQSAHPGLREKLVAMIEACCELFDRDRDLFTFLLLAQHVQRSAPEDYRAALPQSLHALFAHSVQGGEIPNQDIEHTTAMVMGCVLQSALYCLYHKPLPLQMTPLSGTLADACWRIVKGK
jgi:AcrR family transcriptional regulator